MAAKMPWFRLYTEIMDDPKLATWTGDQFRVLIYLFCLARESDEPGLVKMMPAQIAWRIRQPVALVEEVLELAMAGDRPIIAQEPEGYRVHKWDDRQYDYPSDHPAAVAKRARKHRGKKKADAPITNSNNNETVTSRNESVTKPLRAKNDREAEADTDTDTEREAEAEVKEGGTGGENFSSVPVTENDSAVAPAAKIFQQELKRALTPMESEQLAGWCNGDGQELVLEALRRATLQGKPTFRYIGGILDAWRQANLRTLAAVEKDDPVYQRKGDGKARADPAAADEKRLAEGVRAACEYMRLMVGPPESLSREQVEEFFRAHDYGPDVTAAVLARFGGG